MKNFRKEKHNNLTNLIDVFKFAQNSSFILEKHRKAEKQIKKEAIINSIHFKKLQQVIYLGLK